MHKTTPCAPHAATCCTPLPHPFPLPSMQPHAAPACLTPSLCPPCSHLLRPPASPLPSASHAATFCPPPPSPASPLCPLPPLQPHAGPLPPPLLIETAQVVGSRGGWLLCKPPPVPLLRCAPAVMCCPPCLISAPCPLPPCCHVLPPPCLTPAHCLPPCSHVLHHTTGSLTDRSQQERAFREATCVQVRRPGWRGGGSRGRGPSMRHMLVLVREGGREGGGRVGRGGQLVGS